MQIYQVAEKQNYLPDAAGATRVAEAASPLPVPPGARRFLGG